MKVVFMGYHHTGINVCEQCLLQRGIEFVGIVVPPNRPAESLRSIEKWAKENNITIFNPKSCNDPAFIEKIKKIKPDLIISFNYSEILKEELFTIPKYGTINIHPALLPKYRGAHVSNWAIINGETETGVTVHFIDKGVDTGDIIVQKSIQITKEDTCETLSYKIGDAGVIALKEALRQFETGRVTRKKQSGQKATRYKARTPKDGEISWSKSPEEIYNLVRALVHPWPGAFYFDEDGKKVTIKKLTPIKKIQELKAKFS